MFTQLAAATAFLLQVILTPHPITEKDPVVATVNLRFATEEECLGRVHEFIPQIVNDYVIQHSLRPMHVHYTCSPEDSMIPGTEATRPDA